jgi:hypothetical protein
MLVEFARILAPHALRPFFLQSDEHFRISGRLSPEEQTPTICVNRARNHPAAARIHEILAYLTTLIALRLILISDILFAKLAGGRGVQSARATWQ